VLFTTLGSYGDLYPYLAIAREVKKLGHCVTIASSATYRTKVESEGIGFAAIRPDISLENREMMQFLFHQRRGTERVLRQVAAHARESYEDTLDAAWDADVIVTHPITMAAVLAAEKLNLRWISTVLAPISFVSAHDPPVPAPFPWITKLRIFGPGVMRGIWDLAKRESLKWLQPVLDLRKQIGLPPAGHPMFEGGQSPDLVLALFSRLLANPQPDWPPQTVLTGFPFYDSAQPALAPELETFIRGGKPPVVFTLGSSAVGAAGAFYTHSLEAVARTKTRAVLLTGTHPQGLPDRLPENVLTWPYAPHELLFPQASVIVHQGGIGTTAQALRAGRPMLVVPFAHDQFDNAERVRRLGAGTWVKRSNYNARAAGRALDMLLHGSSYAQAAFAAGSSIRNENGSAMAAQLIDGYLRRPRP
jgi:UDP:flavonoid glycosyltransferase YjiC (YdhE family)